MRHYEEWIAEGMKYAPPTKQNIGQQALLRDGLRCAVCGIADMETSVYTDCNETAEEPVSGTKVAYLFSERSPSTGFKVSA
jgi:hypothetical protein